MPTTPFLTMFGRSPIRPLEEHMAMVHACVKQLQPFFAALVVGEWDKVQMLHQDIVSLENKADDIKRELRLHLPNTYFMPVSRSDLLELLDFQDALANKAKDIAGLAFGRKMVLPPQLVEGYLELLHCNIDASAQANTAIHELDELLETGFSGNELKLVDGMIATLSSLEHATDELATKLRQRLFECENRLPPIEVMFLYELVDWTGDLADSAREIGDHLQILLAK